jgi:hypothetical protein
MPSSRLIPQPEQIMWQREFSIETPATPAAVWRLFEDVEGWTAWNAGIEEISIAGPFAEGTEFTMKPPGQAAFTSRLVRVLRDELFEDETIIEGIRALVSHRLERTSPTCTRITYAASVTGPGAEEVGPFITDDFPDVLKALAALAERTET